MKTRQTGSRQEPGPNEDTLALIIKCPDCNTQRAFRINDAFFSVLTRRSSGAEYDTWCEKCGRRISIQMCWTHRHAKWVSERVLFGDRVTVEDDSGLLPQHGEKIV